MSDYGTDSELPTKLNTKNKPCMICRNPIADTGVLTLLGFDPKHLLSTVGYMCDNCNYELNPYQNIVLMCDCCSYVGPYKDFDLWILKDDPENSSEYYLSCYSCGSPNARAQEIIGGYCSGNRVEWLLQ